MVADLHATRKLESWLSGASLVIALDESSDATVAELALPVSGDIVLIVGPEGGLADSERSLLADQGAIAARLGPTVLRTSTAGPVGAAVVLARTPRWGAGT